VRVSPILASRDTVWRPRTPSVPAVDVGETNGYDAVAVNTPLTCDDVQTRRSSCWSTIRAFLRISRKY